MSLLRMSCPYVGTIDLRVIQFNSPMVGTFSTSQTKQSRHHWPIKAAQAQLQLQVQFRNWDEYDRLQKFVRAHHKRSLLTVQYPEVTLYWPERNINNWTGLIQKLEAGDERFNIAPRAVIGVVLIDSMLSDKTFSASMGESYVKWYESDIGDPDIQPPPTTSRPTIPAPPESNEGGTGGGRIGTGGSF